jgi:hypothetical protein
MREIKAGDHQQASFPRLAVLGNDEFKRITTAVATTQSAYQAVNGMTSTRPPPRSRRFRHRRRGWLLSGEAIVQRAV